MRILLINKFYFLKGGAEKHFFELKSLLESHGHDVIVFAMDHPQNLPSPYAEYFVSQVDFGKVRGGKEGLRTAGRMLYSFEARRKLAALIDRYKPEIAHVHNIYHQISPSILPLLRERGIPIVQTIHDFKLISPNYNLFCHGKICERGRSKKFYQNAFHRCVKNSLPASILATAEMYFHAWAGFYRKNVNLFVSPSQFTINKIREWGMRDLNLKLLPNFVNLPPAVPGPNIGEYFLYLGRLSPEKGARTLIEAGAGLTFPIQIAGSGPEEAESHRYAKELQAHNISFLGQVGSERLDELMAGARAVIVPSLCYENSPLTVLEAMARSKPVIASKLGGIPELVQDGVTGLLFPAGDASELRQCLETLVADPDQALRLGRTARQTAEGHDAESYYATLMELYAEVLK